MKTAQNNTIYSFSNSYDLSKKYEKLDTKLLHFIQLNQSKANV